VTRLRVGRPSSVPGRGKDFSLFGHFQTGFGAHGGKASGNVKLNTYLNRVSRLSMRGAISPLPYTSIWHYA